MGKFVISDFLCEQYRKLPVASADISDKSFLVVGANVGLGFEASVHLAQLRPKHLIVTARDDTKCRQTIIGARRICNDGLRYLLTRGKTSNSGQASVQLMHDLWSLAHLRR